MRRIAPISFFVCALLLATPSHAANSSTKCTDSALVAALAASFPSCDITVTCSSLPCRWTISAIAGGVGAVAAKLTADGHAGSYVNCSGINSCAATSPGFAPVGLGQSFKMHCLGDTPLALSESITCSATAT